MQEDVERLAGTVYVLRRKTAVPHFEMNSVQNFTRGKIRRRDPVNFPSGFSCPIKCDAFVLIYYLR